jgi:hypothetical protein
MTTTPESLIGQQVHFLGAMHVPVSTSEWATAASVRYGDTLAITDEVVEAGFTRDGSHWLELAADPNGQIERWGENKFAVGPFPDYLPRKDPNHVDLSDLTTKYRIESTVLNSAQPRRGSFSALQGDDRKGAA